MTQTVSHILHARLVFIEERKQFVDKHPIGCLVARADVVDLASDAVLKSLMNTRTMVINIYPVALV